MKCPKCGYLGFETVDRCRNCGYDFSLAPSQVEGRAPSAAEDRASSEVEKPGPSGAGIGGLISSSVDRPIARHDVGSGSLEPRSQAVSDELASSRLDEAAPGRPVDLTLQDAPHAGNALAEMELEQKTASPAPPIDSIVIQGKSNLDLDRLIGVAEEPSATSQEEEPAHGGMESHALRPRGVSDEHTPLLDAVEADAEAAHLPLFGRARLERESESPIVAPPRPAGPPLAVRRATPEVARPRSRAPRTARRDEPPLSFPLDTVSTRAPQRDAGATEDSSAPFQMASRVSRVAAAVIDLGLLGGICFAVLYFTLRIANLTFDDVRVLPIVPMGAFLVLLVAGYSIAFTAAGGQTIGKMITGIKVIAEDGRPVDVSSAVLRLAGNAVNIATLGLAWLPALFAADGRSLADRLAGTRVIRA